MMVCQELTSATLLLYLVAKVLDNPLQATAQTRLVMSALLHQQLSVLTRPHLLFLWSAVLPMVVSTISAPFPPLPLVRPVMPYQVLTVLAVCLVTVQQSVSTLSVPLQQTKLVTRQVLQPPMK